MNNLTRPGTSLLILEDADALAREAAHRFALGAGQAVEHGHPFRVALSGGTTPLETFHALASAPYLRSVPWGSVEFFWADERFVPFDHTDSNFGAARNALLDRLGAPPAGVFPVPCNAASVEDAAREYEETLRQAFELGSEEIPRFDLILLGLGEDGHTASLFPGFLPSGDGTHAVAGLRPAHASSFRVSLTPATLNAAREIVFLVSGARKASVLEKALRIEAPDPSFPASLVRPVRGKVHWLVDRAAAARVTESAEAPPEG